uniref:ELM2 domain-containing protein n=1 Tax=Coccolithus braarudii TaxID=221442 RepID=A0A7S0LHC2_9EUKA
MLSRVLWLTRERTPEEDAAWLCRLHVLANAYVEPEPAATSPSAAVRPLRKPSPHAAPRRAVASLVSRMEPVPETEEVTSISRVSGRPRKAPRKFKEVVQQPRTKIARTSASVKTSKTPVRDVNGAPQIGARSSSSRSEGRSSGDGRARGSASNWKQSRQDWAGDAAVGNGTGSTSAAAHHPNHSFSSSSPRRTQTIAGDKASAAESSESRIGSQFQARVPPSAMAEALLERGDHLVWSPSFCEIGDVELELYLRDAVQLMCGPPAKVLTPSRMQAAAMEEFPEEVAYRVLQQAGFDCCIALRRLRAESAERSQRTASWSKVEERQLRSAMASKKKDLHAIQEMVKTKDFKAIVRLYYLEHGVKKREKLEKQRELEMLRHSRDQSRSATPVIKEGAAEVSDNSQTEPADETSNAEALASLTDPLDETLMASETLDDL